MSVIKNTFQEALIVLTGHEDAKSRLTRAWIDSLFEMNADELPDGIREMFLAMREQLTTRRPVNNEHPVIATIRKMSPMEAARLGADIVKMYSQVLSADEPVQLRLVERADGDEAGETAADADIVPDFLSRH